MAQTPQITESMSGAGQVDQGDSRAPDLVLLAPMDGWASPLAEVPDPVFAEKMMGDGVAIDPTGATMHAPCDGEIILLHDALHAVTLRAVGGAEILMHVGLDTVALGGQGFTAHVAKGQKVKAGDRLISFDLDQLAQSARSLITPIIIANGEKFSIVTRRENAPVARGQEMMRVRRLASSQASPAAAAAGEFRRDVIVPLAHGLHARPAARLAGAAKGFGAEIVFLAGEKRANARSPIALMGLGLSKDAPVTLIASGSDAEQALAALAALLESGMDEDEAEPVAIVGAPAMPIDAGALAGIRAAPGLSLGTAFHFKRTDLAVPEAGRGDALETAALRHAIVAVKSKLGAAMRKGGAQSAILGAHLAFLDDPELARQAAESIAGGKSAAAAWRDTIDAQIAVLKELKDPRLRERMADLADLKRQVLVALGCATAAPAQDLPPDAILLADDILPSEMAGLDPTRVAGIALAGGGPTSHAAILAASLNIPALVACGEALQAIADGTVLLLDADRGALMIAPREPVREDARIRIATATSARAAARASAQSLCHTRDGRRIAIDANLGSLEDAVKAVAAGAEGCGLLRTEFLFLDRQSPPSEDEQVHTYGAIAQALAGRTLTIRTLDIGGDKPAAYLPFPAEENPALGLRGVRVSLWRPDLLKTQLRAILRSVPAAQCRIMAPMVASLEELRAVRRLLDEARDELDMRETVALGVMVETPAAAVTADILAAEADFLSIGTNDLTQYGLAMDRGNASLAAQFDALHPAVLRLIAATTEGAGRAERPVGVCGGLASDPLAAPILIGLGVTSLSATASQIATLKADIAKRTLDECRALASAALAMTSAAEVRALLLRKGER
ncbi:MAG TPA: phosphoenolpyruvate--protein phosphotransferase [Rhizomicrobium sp.]|nr:phosphoenolpyruvate--protein phosphotransferase [Rhizomicrobium sp.]